MTHGCRVTPKHPVIHCHNRHPASAVILSSSSPLTPTQARTVSLTHAPLYICIYSEGTVSPIFAGILSCVYFSTAADSNSRGFSFKRNTVETFLKTVSTRYIVGNRHFIPNFYTSFKVQFRFPHIQEVLGVAFKLSLRRLPWAPRDDCVHLISAPTTSCL